MAINVVAARRELYATIEAAIRKEMGARPTDEDRLGVAMVLLAVAADVLLHGKGEVNEPRFVAPAAEVYRGANMVSQTLHDASRR